MIEMPRIIAAIAAVLRKGDFFMKKVRCRTAVHV
jgi:hypothetical protein